ncbi:MAG: DNA alkylation repair protein [Pirellulales bacterium]
MMPQLNAILRQLKELGTDQTRKTFARHGIDGDVFGVRVGDLKQVAKALRGEQHLAEDLYASGNYDAKYLAGLIADGRKMSQAAIQDWADQAKWHAIASTAVAWIASESDAAEELATLWIAADRELLQTAGWVTFCGIVATKADDGLDLKGLRALLRGMKKRIARAPNRVRYAMNNFIISAGCYVPALSELARDVAAGIGVVEVDMGETACQVPDAVASIEKVAAMKRIGLKRKTMRC